MSADNNNTAKPLANVQQPERFVTKEGVKYAHKGQPYDLRTIDTATAEALAKDGSCAFLQWKDVSKRPKDQRNPLEVPESAKSATPAPKP